MPKIKKLTLVICLFVFSAFLLQSHPAFSQALSEQEFKEALQNSSFTLEDSSLHTNINLIHSLNLSLWSTGESNKEESLIPGGGAISQTGKFIASLVGRPPVSTSEYLADLGGNLGLPIKSAYAQGVGWQALEPILPIWKAFRNVAYMGFVVIFIIIGFMIMFRKNIDSQTVVNIQNSLPNLVISLLLITFSYAIAGLMIDLIYIAIYFIVGILNLSGILTSSSEAVNMLLTKNPFSLVFVKDGSDIFIQAPGEALQILIEGVFGSWFEDTWLAEGFGGLMKFVLGAALLFSLFKLFLTLLMSYLGIILNVIFAPFSILANALPGSNAFMGWLKNLFSNVIPFPVVAGMFLLSAIIIGPRHSASCGDFDNKWCVQQGIGFYPQAESGSSVWVPPLLNLGKEGGAGEVNAFQGLLAFGIIMMMPQVIGQIKKKLEVEPSGFGGAIAGGLMTGPQAAMGLGQTGWNLINYWKNIQSANVDVDWKKRLLDATQGKKGGASS